MEFLKEILGEALFEQVAEKITAHKEVQLVDLNASEFVRKEEMEQSLARATEEKAASLADLKSMAIEKELLKAGARNVVAVRGLIDETQVEWQEGDLKGLMNQVAALKESDGFLFAEEKKELTTHAGNPAGVTTILDFETMSDEALFAARMNKRS